MKDWSDGGNPDAFPWTSDGHEGTPENGVLSPPRLLRWSRPFARVTGANFFEPLTEVRNHDLNGFWGTLRLWTLGPDIDIRKTDFRRTGDGSYEMAFCPKRDGHLYFMVNDVGFTYGNNRGSAMVEVRDIGPGVTGDDCPQLP